jgi:hypothetical protein
MGISQFVSVSDSQYGLANYAGFLFVFDPKSTLHTFLHAKSAITGCISIYILYNKTIMY